ncbi:MAG: ribosomal protein S18-alanine N-acetyltransferase [Clostridia bacterium]|nr:ribosomal protein S18-alanine N-acetyltransferase [Clostridia bacterium]
MIKIEKMTLEDAKKAYEIERECFSVPHSLSDFEMEAQRDISYFALAKDGEEIMGYCGIVDVSKEGNISTFAVREDYRGKGIGKMLFQHIISYAKEQKMEFITLEVRKTNAPAIKIYESLGFKVLGVRKDYYTKPKEDALIMTLFL